MDWTQENFAATKRSHPTLKQGEIMQLLSQAYKSAKETEVALASKAHVQHQKDTETDDSLAAEE